MAIQTNLQLTNLVFEEDGKTLKSADLVGPYTGSKYPLNPEQIKALNSSNILSLETEKENG